MLILATTSATLSLVTSAAVTVAVHASYVDVTSGAYAGGGGPCTAISTATTTPVVGSPAASTQRTVNSLLVRNTHATLQVDVTVRISDGTTPVDIFKTTLLAGESFEYFKGGTFTVRDSFARPKVVQGNAIGVLNTVVLPADVTNNNATLNTMQDITGLGFPVVAGETYWYYFCGFWTAAVSTTGARFAINGPALTQLSGRSNYTINATTETLNSGISAYDSPAAANAGGLTLGNVFELTGFISPSASGNVIARFASEIASSAVVAKAGSLLQWMRTR